MTEEQKALAELIETTNRTMRALAEQVKGLRLALEIAEADRGKLKLALIAHAGEIERAFAGLKNHATVLDSMQTAIERLWEKSGLPMPEAPPAPPDSVN
jgi:chromosome segregation ATPase